MKLTLEANRVLFYHTTSIRGPQPFETHRVFRSSTDLDDIAYEPFVSGWTDSEGRKRVVEAPVKLLKDLEEFEWGTPEELAYGMGAVHAVNGSSFWVFSGKGSGQTWFQSFDMTYQCEYLEVEKDDGGESLSLNWDAGVKLVGESLAEGDLLKSYRGRVLCAVLSPSQVEQIHIKDEFTGSRLPTVEVAGEDLRVEEFSMERAKRWGEGGFSILIISEIEWEDNKATLRGGFSRFR